MNTINFNLLTPAIFAIGEKNNCDLGVAADIDVYKRQGEYHG